MVVEDEAIAAMDLEMVLDDLGYEVCAVASSGTEAVRAAAAVKPDLILMDIRLANGTDGVEAARQILGGQGIRSIFLTAHNDPVTLERANGASPLDVLTKPYSRTRLITALHRAALEIGHC